LNQLQEISHNPIWSTYGSQWNAYSVPLKEINSTASDTECDEYWLYCACQAHSGPRPSTATLFAWLGQAWV